MSVTQSAREQWLERFRDQIGRARNEVTTPALILDLDVAKRNIAAMAEKFRDLPAGLRPHIKVHKSIELARLQVEAGADHDDCLPHGRGRDADRAGIDLHVGELGALVHLHVRP